MIPSIDEDVAREEERYDGFYAVCTNLEDDAATIISINQKRWQIEECFRIMKRKFYSTDFNDSTISICAVNLHTISWIKREQPTTINETIIYDINRK